MLKTQTWYFLLTQANSGSFNMACDNYLLDCFVQGEILNPLLRLYSWSEETLSIGANQKKDVLNHKNNYPLVKRTSGGQSILHEMSNNEITYSIFLKSKKNAKDIYYEIGNIFIAYLKNYGLNASIGSSNEKYMNHFNCFECKTPADIVVGDIKIIGSAQYRKKEYLMQHGSIKLGLIRQLSGIDLYKEKAIVDLKIVFKQILNIQFTDYSLSEVNYEKINSIAIIHSDNYIKTNANQN